ncbi:MAG: NAD(P)-dependent oxidoreductase [Emcibacteraceae bacterium]|nr:NAD(P)-dependent oxidoreductase [Emcibacteraceae bacterium]
MIEGWKTAMSVDICAFDIKTQHSLISVREIKEAEYVKAEIRGCESLEHALNGADLVFSFVTADQTLLVAESAAPYIKKGAIYFDCNSCAPQTKQRACKILSENEAIYIDVAIMSPIHTLKHRTPMLISGLHSQKGADVFLQLNMIPTIVQGDVGTASSIKMMRSIMVKGFEALLIECLLAARKAGVEEQVFDSLEVSDPEIKWRRRMSYALNRVTVHGERRAAEMREVLSMLHQLGIDGKMAKATTFWQQTVGELKLKVHDKEYQQHADYIIQKLPEIEVKDYKL